MRISPIGYLFGNEYDITKQTLLVTSSSPNSIETIYASKIVALIIYYGKLGMTKEDIINKLELSLNFLK